MTIRTVTIAMIFFGLALLIYSLSLPYYSDQMTEEERMLLEREEYYEREALRTNKTQLMDFGAGLTIAALTFLLFLLITRIEKTSDFSKVKTMNKIMVFVSANLIWLLMIPGTHWYYSFRGGRGDYPPFADSIGIPIMTQVPFLLILMIPLNIFLALTTYKASLPTHLFISSDRKDNSIALTELFFGSCIALNCFLLLMFIYDGDHVSIFVNIFFTYILLNLRAGRISKWVSPDQQ